MSDISEPGTIPITKVVFGPEEFAAVQRPLETGWVVQGPYVSEFEKRFASYARAPHAIATTSCTTALQIAVTALGVRPGDEVIVPAFTWVATPNVVEWLGGKPVFCDIDLATFNIDTTLVESLITPRTVGILPVHLFGLCAEMGPLLQTAKRYGLWIIEDAACGLGAWYHGRHAGTFGDAGCFSFHPRKSITTGEGGMITTANGALAETARSLRDHGAARSDLQRHTSKGAFLLSEYDNLGFNFRMTDIQGALGSAQMNRIDWILERRRSLATEYDHALADIGWLRTPVIPPGSVHGHQAYVTLFAPEEPDLMRVSTLHERRNTLMSRLERAGIATRQGTHAPITLGYYKRRYNVRPEAFPNAYVADRLSLALPLFPQMTEAEQARVVDALRRV